jgi:hypothetical protein
MVTVTLLAQLAYADDLVVTLRAEGLDGSVVPGAVVTLLGPGGESAAEQVADPSGRATLDVTGAWHLSVTADGFRPTEARGTGGGERVVWLEPGKPAVLEVVVEGLKVTADATRYAVDGEQAVETPGTLEDAVRLVQALPGVTVQREYSPSSGDLSVRGSTTGDSRYFLDGIEIPYLYHYNQYASVFPATQIASLELFPSTFSARYGDSVGAVIEARSHEAPPTELHGSAHVNFVMAGGDVTAPFGRPDVGGKRPWWFSAAARRSYQDLAGEGSLQYPLWPVFGDFVARAERGNDRHGTGVFVFGASDRWTRAAGELDTLDPYEATAIPAVDHRQGFEGVGVRTRSVTDARSVRAAVGLVHHARGAELADLGGERLSQWTASSRTDATWRADRTGFDAGWELVARRVAYQVDDVGPAGLRVAEEGPGLARGVAVDDTLLRAQGGVYGTAHFQAGDFRLMPGVRVSADSTAAELPVDPRAAVRWTLGDQTVFKAAAGHYSQRPDSEQLFPGTGDPDLPTTKSDQVSLGWEQTVAGRLELGVETYHKALRDPLLFPIDRPAYAVPSGRATGAELITRYRIRELVFLWGWLAVQQTVLQDEAGEPIPGDGDQRLAGGAVVSFDTRGWNVGARYRFASGLPFTPLDGSVYDAGRDSWVPVVGDLNSDRLPVYHKVDLRAAKTWDLRGWSLTLTTELWLVPKSSAALYPIWNYDYTEQGFVVGPTLLPLLGARVRF